MRTIFKYLGPDSPWGSAPAGFISGILIFVAMFLVGLILAPPSIWLFKLSLQHWWNWWLP